MLQLLPLDIFLRKEPIGFLIAIFHCGQKFLHVRDGYAAIDIVDIGFRQRNLERRRRKCERVACMEIQEV
jgi:hypothetical protein